VDVDHDQVHVHEDDPEDEDGLTPVSLPPMWA